jgi:hypothetical protein
MIGGDADIQRYFVEAHIGGRRRFDLGPEQRQTLASFIGREQFSPHLQLEDVGRLVQPEVGNEQIRLDPDEGFRQVAAWLLDHPFQTDRCVDDEPNDQSPLSCPTSQLIRSTRPS